MMQQVRTVRPHHVTPTAPGTAAIELSREEREQLRIVRHHAFERHQRNAAWTRELLQSNVRFGASRNDASVTNGHVPTPSDDVVTLRQSLEQQQQAVAEDQVRHTELLNALRAIDSDDALAACRVRVEEETTRHAHAVRKESKVIRL